MASGKNTAYVGNYYILLFLNGSRAKPPIIRMTEHVKGIELWASNATPRIVHELLYEIDRLTCS